MTAAIGRVTGKLVKSTPDHIFKIKNLNQMKPNYSIDISTAYKNLGHNRIVIDNYKIINTVMGYATDETDINLFCDPKTVAIFKIKWK